MIVQGRDDEHDAERAAVGLAGRYGHRGHVQEIGEVGVGAEAPVDAERVGSDGIDGRVFGGDGQQQRIDLGERGECMAADGGESVEVGGERVAGDAAAAAMIPATMGSAPGRGGGEELPHRGVALCDDGAVVEQGRCPQQLGDVDLGDCCTVGGEPVDGRGERDAVAGGQLVEVGVAGNGDPRRGGRGEADVGWPRAAAGVGRIGAGHDGQRALRSAQVRGEDGDAIVVGAGRYDAGGGNYPEAGFEPDDALERRRDAAGACGVGADADVDQAEPTSTAEPDEDPPEIRAGS